MNSNRKGKRGELEFARYLSAMGFAARRGQQFAGGTDSPDVVCPALSHVHFEVKRVENLRLYDALAQAKADAGDRAAVVAYRRNRGDWVAVLPMATLLELLEGRP